MQSIETCCDRFVESLNSTEQQHNIANRSEAELYSCTHKQAKTNSTKSIDERERIHKGNVVARRRPFVHVVVGTQTASG